MRFVATAVAVGLAALLAGAGALVLGRRPRGLVGWNEAFLVGGGLAAALLFAFSAALGPFALLSLATLVASAGVAGLVFARRRSPCGGAPAPEAAPGPIDLLLAAWTVAALLVFAAANVRYHLLWDGLYVWATKAMLLFDEGRLAPVLWAGPELEGRVGRVAAYPPLVPLLEALVALVRGSFDFDAGKPVFVLFYASLLAGSYGAGRSLGGRRAGLLAAALVAALPPLSTSWAAGGYADMPQAAALVALVGALLRGDETGPPWRQSAPWLLGAVVSVKSEGTILAVLALGACALAAVLAGGLRGAAAAARRQAGALLVAAAFLAQRMAYTEWTAAPYALDYRPVNAATLVDALRRVPEVAGLVLAEMARVRSWGLLWPAFGVAGAALVLRGGVRVRALALSTAAAVALYASTFLFTNWPVALHVQTALDRILAQLAPAAVLVVLAALLPAEGGAPEARRPAAPAAPPVAR